MRIHIAFVLTSFVCIVANAQVDESWSYFFNIKNHHFYDTGVYEVGNTNQATAYGLGAQAQRRLSKRFGCSFGYSLALADSISANQGWTRNAMYHQFEGNITLQPKRFKRIKPYLFSGYAYNIVPQLAKNNTKATGLNINTGGGLEVKLDERIGIAYQTTYGYNLTDHIPYNFRHQFGVILYPSRFKNREQPQIIVSPKDQKRQFENGDSLQMVIDSLTQIIAQSIDCIHILRKLEATRNIHLDTNISHSGGSNPQDSQEINIDSIPIVSFSGYALIASNERIVSVGNTTFLPGYYLMTDSLTSLQDARRLGRDDTYSSLGAGIHYLNSGDTFTILGFVGVDSDKALQQAMAAKQKGIQVRVVRLR